MRVALLSDLHGNLPALEAVLRDIGQSGPFDQVVVAGDLVWDGGWPSEVVDRVRALGAPVIQGNTDAFFLRNPEDPPQHKDPVGFVAEMAWMKERLGPERIEYLCRLPFSHRISPGVGHDLLVVHATPRSNEEKILPQMSEAELDEILGPVEACDWEVLVFGHLHIPFVLPWRNRLLVDVASAGLPKDDDQRAVYAVLTWDGRAWHAEHRRVLYEVPVVIQHMRTCGLPRAKQLSERLLRASY